MGHEIVIKLTTSELIAQQDAANIVYFKLHQMVRFQF